jgi:hypothetical protein
VPQQYAQSRCLTVLPTAVLDTGHCGRKFVMHAIMVDPPPRGESNASLTHHGQLSQMADSIWRGLPGSAMIFRMQILLCCCCCR